MTSPSSRLGLGLRLAATVLATSVVNLASHATAYALILADFYRAHPAGSPEFVRELNRSADELVPWAMVVTSLTMGAFITMVMRWSRPATPREDVRNAVLLGVLFWVSVNSGLYASSRVFSLPSVLVDTPCSALSMAIAAVSSAWMMRRLRADVRSSAER